MPDVCTSYLDLTLNPPHDLRGQAGQPKVWRSVGGSHYIAECVPLVNNWFSLHKTKQTKCDLDKVCLK